MEKYLALHIQDLESGLAATDRAEDRPKLEKLLAYAGCLLSKVVLNTDKEELFQSIESFNHLWGHTWLEGTWQQENKGSYEKFKTLAGYSDRGHT